NEAMDASTIIPSLSPAGIRTFASGDTIPLATTLVDGKTLIITPEATLVPNQRYTLSIDPNTTARDTAGYPLSTLGEQAQKSSQSYRVTTGGLPGTPEGVTLSYYDPFGGVTRILTSDAATGIDFTHINNLWSGFLRLYWNPPSDGGPVTGYRVYAAIDSDSASNYVLLGETTNNYWSFPSKGSGGLVNALFGTENIDPVATKNYPLINKAVYFKVVAYNGDGEGSAASTSGLKELVGPKLDTKAFSGRTGGGFTAAVQNNNYYLAGLKAGTDTKIAYIAFNEPVDPSTITAGNFTHSAGTVTGATLLTSSSSNLSSGVWSGDVFSIVKIISDTDFAAGHTITVRTGVKDLAGNPVVTGTGDSVTIP
ncbi:MAG: Ig-like domain-containing protein, partial [Candidatus Margulisiibacteriota bacterium]